MNLGNIRESTKAVIFAVVIGAGLLGLAVLGSHLSGRPIDREEIRDVQITILGEGWSIDCTMTATVNNTVYHLLMECSEMYDFEVDATVWQPYNAMFVDSINGLENGEGKWWQYYVNGRYGDISSDKRELNDGDLVEWRFESPRQ